MRSDSLSTLRALVKLAAKSPSLNVVMRELALDLASAPLDLLVAVHTPGVANLVPDALSRRWAPEPKPLPAVLVGCPQVEAPRRTPEFWRAVAAPAQRQ